MIAEIECEGFEVDEIESASMRPRSDDRGNFLFVSVRFPLLTRASMRPRSDDRGNWDIPAEFLKGDQCFNEAAIR